VCGGGRYDALISQLGGAETPAIGWAMGVERLILLLEKLQPLNPPAPDFYFVSRGKKAEGKALIIAQQLRQAGFTVELDLTGSNFDKQFKRGERSGAKAYLILGDSEVEKGIIQLKWLATREQIIFEQKNLISELKEQFSDQV
jgi:histidyl-tRNA synthetase